MRLKCPRSASLYRRHSAGSRAGTGLGPSPVVPPPPWIERRDRCRVPATGAASTGLIVKPTASVRAPAQCAAAPVALQRDTVDLAARLLGVLHHAKHFERSLLQGQLDESHRLGGFRRLGRGERNANELARIARMGNGKIGSEKIVHLVI